MSAEYRPVSILPFDLLDDRLEKYGISVDRKGSVTCLIGPHGVLVAKPEGNSTHFERSLGVDTQVVLDALALEYGIEIVDEDDLRFWGFSSVAEMTASREKALCWNDLWILVEGPAVSDAQFAVNWLQAALDADRILEHLFEQYPDLRSAYLAARCRLHPLLWHSLVHGSRNGEPSRSVSLGIVEPISFQ